MFAKPSHLRPSCIDERSSARQRASRVLVGALLTLSPGHDGSSERLGDLRAELDHVTGGTDLDEDRRHLGLTKDRDGHALCLRGLAERATYQALHPLSEVATCSRFIGVAGIVGNVATLNCIRELDPDVDVNPGSVGLGCLGRLLEMAEQGDASTSSAQPAGQGGGDDRPEPVDLAETQVPATKGGRLEASKLGFPDRGHEGKGLVSGGDTDELVDRPRPGDAVDWKLHVSLELGQGLCGGVTEDPIDSTGVEAERAQAALELGHVVAPKHRMAAVDEAVTEAQTGLNQRRPGAWPDDPVDPKPPDSLKRLDGGARRRAEVSHRVGDREGGDPRQPLLQVFNRGSKIPLSEGEDRDQSR